MDTVYVVYWSQSGNTQAMAEAVGAGAQASGSQTKIVPVSEVSPDELKGLKGFALGCPAMGSEELEESEMEPFVAEIEKFAAGKTIGLFGSYGWGDGEWMRNWTDRMKAAGATVPGDEGVIACGEPDDAAKSACEALGGSLAAY
jgi:flavodoxin short chain